MWVTSRPARAWTEIPLYAVSWIVFKLVPGRAAAKLAEFSHTEAGSGLDMLAAVEETPRPELRLRYFRHALDELNHSVLFRRRAGLWSKGKGRAQAVLDDAEYIGTHGIRQKDSLIRELGELEFLAFVWVHEKRGAEQFQVLSDLLQDDRDTQVMFAEIARDERFHIAYSRAELDRYRKQGQGWAVRTAVTRVWGRRYLQAWLRLSRELGNFMAGLWLGLIYLFMVGPFSLLARHAEREQRGFLRPGPDSPDPIATARELG